MRANSGSRRPVPRYPRRKRLRLVNQESPTQKVSSYTRARRSQVGLNIPMHACARKPLTALLIAAMAGWVSHARAEDADKPGEKERVDTEFIFGFTAGADVGEVGEKEQEHQTSAQWNKRDGSYAAGSDQLRFETSPAPNFRFEIGAPIVYFNVSGVTGLDDRNQAPPTGSRPSSGTVCSIATTHNFR
jgi:hypothetical protein